MATSGALPASYQWVRDGTNLVDGGNVLGSTSRVLILTNIGVADAAIYSVVVSNAYGPVTSSGARLEVVFSPPFVLSGPEDQTLLAGSTVSFSVEAGGDDDLAFQWQKNGTNLVDGGNISGTATATLTLGAVSASSAGTYSLLISNAAGVTSSPGATLIVLPTALPSVALTSLHAFTGDTNGFNPYGGLAQGANGILNGTALNGGSGYAGIVFRLSLSGGFAVVHSFTGGADGSAPYAGLVQAGQNTFYGATFEGGAALDGALFRMAANNIVTPLHSLVGGEDGANPVADLVQGSDGRLYGCASTGGTNGQGTVFALTTSGVFTPLWSFHSTDGSQPLGPLAQGRDGKLYGTTCTGGAKNLGTVFSLTTNGLLTSLASLDYTVGAYPSNGLVAAADGAFYGTASNGGTNGGWGTVFRIAADGTLTSLHSFDYDDGALPVGGLVQATDGNLYGTTSQGGVGGQGTVFQITTNGALTTLVWFYGPNGANPQASLIQANDGSFYGTTEFGGPGFSGAPESGNGLVFRLIVPMFLSPSLTQAVATVGLPYAASLAGSAGGFHLKWPHLACGDWTLWIKSLGPRSACRKG